MHIFFNPALPRHSPRSNSELFSLFRGRLSLDSIRFTSEPTMDLIRKAITDGFMQMAAVDDGERNLLFMTRKGLEAASFKNDEKA